MPTPGFLPVRSLSANVAAAWIRPPWQNPALGYIETLRGHPALCHSLLLRRQFGRNRTPFRYAQVCPLLISFSAAPWMERRSAMPGRNAICESIAELREMAGGRK